MELFGVKKFGEKGVGFRVQLGCRHVNQQLSGPSQNIWGLPEV